MDRIKIDIQAWESAQVPICTKLVNIDLAEQLLYQGMVMDYGYTDDEIMHLVNIETAATVVSLVLSIS